VSTGRGPSGAALATFGTTAYAAVTMTPTPMSATSLVSNDFTWFLLSKNVVSIRLLLASWTSQRQASPRYRERRERGGFRREEFRERRPAGTR
jgi:hypothetical protein